MGLRTVARQLTLSTGVICVCYMKLPQPEVYFTFYKDKTEVLKVEFKHWRDVITMNAQKTFEELEDLSVDDVWLLNRLFYAPFHSMINLGSTIYPVSPGYPIKPAHEFWPIEEEYY